MILKEQIKTYVPFNEQEVKDKENILKFMDTYEDVLTRENEVCHFASSAFVVNKTRDKALMVYHNIYNSWAWTGGHADGDSDLRHVALKELNEETGITNFKLLSNDIFALDILPVIGHVKRGAYVSAHLHLCTTYLVEADENEVLRVLPEENSGVAWINISELKDKCAEAHMVKVYLKICDKMKSLGL
jgi:8-oxo-dGTP pyrophosphatase MutT (NUDIX family)